MSLLIIKFLNLTHMLSYVNLFIVGCKYDDSFDLDIVGVRLGDMTS
jgi:hypothetical protein